jgi:hypothetical protein
VVWNEILTGNFYRKREKQSCFVKIVIDLGTGSISGFGVKANERSESF